MAETPSGMLNSIGLQGPGIDSFIENDLAWLAAHGARTIVSIAGGHTDDFAGLARKLYGNPAVAAIEVNISCPNVESRGQVFACDAIASSRVIGAVRRAADPAQPVFAKLSPDVTDIVHIARACADAGADGFSLINTLLGHGDRHRHARAGARRDHRGTVRPGDPAGRGALRVAGAPGAAAPADHRHGRHPHRPGRAAVRPRRRVGGVGRHGGVRRPDRAGPGAGRARGRAGRARASRRWPTPSASPTSIATARGGRLAPAAAEAAAS